VEFKFPKREKIKLTVYRNIATCSPSQFIFDDLVDSEEEFNILIDAESTACDINKEIPGQYRCRQYGNVENSLLCFDERFWRWGRFGDGTFGVWYSAVEEATSVQETLHHRPEIDRNDLANADGPIIQDRRMFEADLNLHDSVELRGLEARHPGITDPVEYAFCQKLGRKAVELDIVSFRTPSVRREGGTCVPVFDPSVIKDRKLYDYWNFFPKDGAPFSTKKMPDQGSGSHLYH